MVYLAFFVGSFFHLNLTISLCLGKFNYHAITNNFVDESATNNFSIGHWFSKLFSSDTGLKDKEWNRQVKQ